MEKNKKQRVILDTDMGVDCDDAVALAILLNKQIAKELEILCVTTSTTRSGAVSTVRAIAEYYGESVTVGAMAKPALGCDKLNNYSAAVMEKYGAPDGACEAVKLLRKTLAEAKEKITLVAIGPLVNLARLLKSEADEISALGGVELLERSVEEIFCMGGSFAQNFGENPEKVEPEWNILQDIKSAQYFTRRCPVKAVFVPWEAGAEVFTEMKNGENPVWYSMRRYAESVGYEVNRFRRMSWDPITCLCATENCEKYFDYSSSGKITILEDGKSVFEEGEGNHRILLLKKGFEKISERVNAGIEPIRKESERLRRIMV